MHRRHFLTGAAGAAAGVLLPRRATAQPAGIATTLDDMITDSSDDPAPVVEPGEFTIAAAYLDHAHIRNQCEGLIAAGATLKWVLESDAKALRKFRQRFPYVRVARSEGEILDDPDVKLVATAAVPNERGPFGCRVMAAGKDFFSDKPAFTTLDQFEAARQESARTGRKFIAYFSERTDLKSADFVTEVVRSGALGRIVEVSGVGPHRISKPKRPDWFFDPSRSGGILCDLGSHQVENYLFYSGAGDAQVAYAAVGNYANADKPGFEDFGEAVLVGDNGTTCHFRVDWYTPDGLSTWGDGRSVILGTKGYIEMRKYVDVAREQTVDHVYVVDEQEERHLSFASQGANPFYGRLILDCLHRTEIAVTQAHMFRALELSLRAQAAATWLTQ